MKAAIYLRVSTTEQTTLNQELELREVAKKRGWEVVKVYSDSLSGMRADRPALNEMLAEADRYDVVMAWAIDRLGRSLTHLLGIITSLHAKKVNLYLHQQQIDTTTPMGKLIFQVTGAFAEFERSMIVERINAGLSRARLEGKKLGRRPSIAAETVATACERLSRGESKAVVASGLGISLSTVKRLGKAMAHV